MIRGLRGIAALVGVAVLALGCSAGSGESEPDDQVEPQLAERVVAGDFDALKAADGFQVRVARGPESQVTVSSSGIPEEQVEAVIDGETLELSTKSGSVPAGVTLNAAVMVPTLTEVTATSGAQVVLLEGLAMDAEDASIELTAGARFAGEVSADSLNVILQAGARAQVSGSVGKALIVGSEAGELDGADLAVADAKVTLSSGATAELTVRDTLDVSLSSGSELVYAGNPRITNREVGSGAALRSSSN